MLEVSPVPLGRREALGVKLDLQHAPLLVIRTPKGYLACGYINLEAAEKLGDVAAVVRGVNSFDDMLGARITAVTSGAAALGVKAGDSGREALENMF